jgi:hypothetical protein
MSDALVLRTAFRAADAALVAGQQQLATLIAEGNNPWLGPLSPIKIEIPAQAEAVVQLTLERSDALSAFQAAAAADPLHAIDAGVPLVLLPVRIETAYLPGANGTDLVVRVYPDDIHVDAHETELTGAELAAGTAYWLAVWGAGSNQSRLDAAWAFLLAQLKPSRAAWALHVLTPAVPRPTSETPEDQPQPVPPLPTVPTRSGTFTRAAQTTLLPDYWHVIGFRDGAEFFSVDGSPIPDALNVSFGPPGTGAHTTNLPFDDASSWLVDLNAAIAVGMAIRIPLTGPDFSIDQLFVIGVSARLSPTDAAGRLQSAMLAYQYTNGLGFLPPGTPTNNTSTTRSAWQTAPQPPTPSQLDAARSGYLQTSNQNAALTANALSVDGTAALSIADYGLEDQQSAIPILQRQLWNSLQAKALSLIFTQWFVPPGSDPTKGYWVVQDNPAISAMLQDHVTGWVRSRGTLPTLRVGNQPYGLLPASSLVDWVTAADDVTAPLAGWLRSFLPYFQAAVTTAPRVVVGSDRDPDTSVADVLQRLPVSQSILYRRDGDPYSSQGGTPQSLPIGAIPGLPTSSELFYSSPEDDAAPMPLAIVGDSQADQSLLLEWLGLFNDCLAVLNGTMLSEDWNSKYSPLFPLKGAPPPDLFTTMLQESFTDPLASDSVPGSESMASFVVQSMIDLASDFDNEEKDPDFQKALQLFLPIATQYVAQFAQLCAIDPASYDPILRELLDITSHRFDAWVTSLFARRLGDMRAAKPTGIVLGAYGWVEDLAPRTDLCPMPTPPAGFDKVFTGNGQKYIHAPSLQHAATAAVLRSGYDSHPDLQALAVNLESERVRKADWLAAGVREGQTVGALLGYRFERGLHDAQLDALIDTLRAQYPLPLPTGTDQDTNGAAARALIAARSVVNGLDCVRQRDAVIALFEAADQATAGALLDDLADVLDAYGDLLLAESVHHLVAGNPLRAGLSADMVGRGEQIPDRFDVVQTPRTGRSLTWQVGALLPSAFRAAVTGWSNDRPRATVEPHVDAWVAAMLGDADLWQIACSITSEAGEPSSLKIGLDTTGLCALDIICELSGDNSVLERRIVDLVSATQPAGSVVTVVTSSAIDGSLGFAELRSLTSRIQSILAPASALGPQHVQGPDASPTLGIDIAELASRLGSLQASLSSAVNQLAIALESLTAAQGAALPAAAQAVRASLLVLANIGVVSAYPIAGSLEDPNTLNALSAQARAVLSATQPLSSDDLPATPAANASSSEVQLWLRAASDSMQNVLGKTIPLLPSFLLPASSSYATSFATNAAPLGARQPAVMAWLRRLARVRPNITALHDLLLASESFAGSEPEITCAQLPVESGAPWIGLPYENTPPSRARLATVVSTPASIDPSAAFCGLLFDTWTEQLPGLTSVADQAQGYEPSEVTGVAFTVTAPANYPPQAILLAVPPDTSAGWSLDVLFDVVQETLDLAKIRTVDLGDVPRLGRVLPGIHSGSNLDNVLNAAGVGQ